MCSGSFTRFLISASAHKPRSNATTKRKPSALTPRGRSRQHLDVLSQGDALKNTFLLAVAITLSLTAFAQTNSQTLSVEPMSPTPVFRVSVVSRSVQAVNYKHRSGASKVDFAGTDLMPSASGQ